MKFTVYVYMKKITIEIIHGWLAESLLVQSNVITFINGSKYSRGSKTNHSDNNNKGKTQAFTLTVGAVIKVHLVFAYSTNIVAFCEPALQSGCSGSFHKWI